MLDEAGEEWQKPGYNPERHFLNHREQEMSMMAADLVSEPYELSKYHSRFQKLEVDADKLDEIIPRVLEDLKYAIVSNEANQLERDLKKAQRDKNDAEVDRLSMALYQLQQTRRDLGKRLGERIVIR
jgi:DNA primase